MKEYSRTEIEWAINEYILNERNRKIMYRRLVDGMCFEPISEEFSMSPRQIKRIVYKCEEIIFKHI